jgi:hypothetical protein
MKQVTVGKIWLVSAMAMSASELGGQIFVNFIHILYSSTVSNRAQRNQFLGSAAAHPSRDRG